MNSKASKTAFFTAVALASSMAFAAEPSQPAPNPQARGDMSMHHQKKPDGGMGGMGGMDGMKGMMGGGMMDMMGSCHEMMSKKGTAAGAGMPQLPPGNEKLEFQMHAEMMQKMGEIALKYADRIKEK